MYPLPLSEMSWKVVVSVIGASIRQFRITVSGRLGESAGLRIASGFSP
jgi:hypothetical protein